MTLTKEQLVKNSIWTLAELTLFPILVIIATPVFISKLGIEQYGLWMLVVTITQIINILNIGIGDTLIRLISNYRAQQLIEPIIKVFHYSFSFSFFLFAITAIVGYLLSQFNFVALFYASNDYALANKLVFLATISWGFKFIEGSILSVFKAFERFDLNSKLSLVSKNSVVIANLLMIAMGYDLLFAVQFSLLVSALNIVIQLLVLHRFNSALLAFPSLAFFKVKSDYIGYNFWYWLQSSIALVGFLTDKLAVAWFTDVKTLGYYYIASMIGANIHNVFLAFGAFIFPRVSFKATAKTSIVPLYYLSRALIAIPGWLLIIFLIVGGDFIFKAWLGNETYLQSIYFIKLYLVFEAGMLLIIVPFHFINGTSQLKLNSVFEACIRITHFIAMLTGYYMAGVNGIVYGLIASTFLNIPFQYYFFHKHIVHGVNQWQSIFILLPVISLLAVLIFPWLLVKLLFILIFIASIKFVYFDPAQQHSQHINFNRE